MLFRSPTATFAGSTAAPADVAVGGPLCAARAALALLLCCAQCERIWGEQASGNRDCQKQEVRSVRGRKLAMEKSRGVSEGTNQCSHGCVCED